MTSLSARWLAAGGSAAAYDVLVHRYAEPHRRYHTLDHIRAVVEEVSEAGEAAVLAAFCHDVVYDGQPGLDEAASAEWARTWLGRSGVPAPVVERVAALVLLTADHAAPPDDDPAAVLLDADLAVLAAPVAAYDGYAVAIRAEWDWLSDAEWRAGRAAVLRGLLGRPALFAGRPDREAAARANLGRELTALESAP